MTRSRESRRMVGVGLARRLPLWALLGGAAGLWVRPLESSVTPAAPSVQTVNDNVWVEPGPILPNQNAILGAPLNEPDVNPSVPMPPGVPAQLVTNPKPSLGRPDVVPIAEVRSTYDSNIFYDPKNQKADLYTTVVAGLAVGWGDFRDQIEPLGTFQQTYEELRTPQFDVRRFFYASYTPGYTAFLKNTGEDTLDQNANVGARWEFGGLTCDFRANYRIFSEALVDAGTRIRQTQLDIALNSRYDLTGRISAEADLDVVTHHFDNRSLVDSTEWIDQNYLNYQVFSKTSISAGATFGYVSVDSGPNQVYEQMLSRVVYDTDRGISANLFGGVEFRQFDAGNVPSETNPVFGASLLYSPFAGTNLSVSGSRLQTPSAEYVGQDIETSRVSVTCTQDLFGKATLSLQGTYGSLDYGDNGGVGDIHRSDNWVGMEASVAFHVTASVSVSLEYDYSHNESSLSQFSFVDNRGTVDVNMLF